MTKETVILMEEVSGPAFSYVEPISGEAFLAVALGTPSPMSILTADEAAEIYGGLSDTELREFDAKQERMARDFEIAHGLPVRDLPS